MLFSLLELLAGEKIIDLTFVGDAMQHGPQIRAAQRTDGSYDYSPCFSLIANELQRIQQLEVHHTNNHILDFKASRPFLWQVVLLGIILLLLVGNACQFKRNMQLSDNDLKYRLIKMYGGISGNELDTLEVVFYRDRNKTVIRNIRNEVEDFEYRTRVRAEKLEKARLLQQEAQELE